MTNINKKICKILLAIIIIQFIFAIGNISHAGLLDDIFDFGNKFLDTGKEAAGNGEVTGGENGDASITISTPNSDDLKTIINDIWNILFPIGVAVTVIIGGVLGIKFMMASAEDKAKIKESLVPYVAGCIVIYGAFGIWKLAITVFSALG